MYAGGAGCARRWEAGPQFDVGTANARDGGRATRLHDDAREGARRRRAARVVLERDRGLDDRDDKVFGELVERQPALVVRDAAAAAAAAAAHPDRRAAALVVRVVVVVAVAVVVVRAAHHAAAAAAAAARRRKRAAEPLAEPSSEAAAAAERVNCGVEVDPVVGARLGAAVAPLRRRRAAARAARAARGGGDAKPLGEVEVADLDCLRGAVAALGLAEAAEEEVAQEDLAPRDTYSRRWQKIVSVVT